MLLRECLALVAPTELSGMVDLAGLPPRADRKAAEAALAEHLLTPAGVRQTLGTLGEEEWAALKVVAHAGGQDGITVELCQQIVNLMSGRRRKTSSVALIQLQNRGLVYVTTRNYRQVFFIPADLLVVLTAALADEMQSRVCVDDGDLTPLPPERDLLEDLHRFLAYVYKNEVTLTQQGQIFKRHQRALLDLLHARDLGEDTVTGRYPEPLGLLVGFALHQHLVLRDEGMLRAAVDLTDWLRQGDGAKRHQLYEYWRDRYYYHQDLQTFLSTARAVGGRWVSARAVAAELEPLLNPSQRNSFQTRVRFHLVTFLAPLGVFELAQLPGEAAGASEIGCRLTDTGEALLAGQEPPEPVNMNRRIILQANFELIVARPVHSQTLWHLEVIADLLRSDSALIYQMSRQSVYRALKTGMSGEQLLRFLQEHSSTAVPQNVAFNLQEWARAYGQVYLQEATLLRCSDPGLARMIRASRRTGRYIIDQVGPTDLVVHRDDYEALMAALLADGLLPRPGIAPSPPSPAPPEAAEAEGSGD